MPEETPGAFLDPSSEDMLARVASAARYAQIARTADSVTHDVNNLLGAGSAYAELIGLDANINDETRRMLNEIVTSLSRCGTLVASLTALTRKEAVLANGANAGALLRDSIMMSGHALRRARVALEEQYPTQELTIVGDTPRLQVALLNLIANAREQAESLDTSLRQVRVSVETEGEFVTFHVHNAGPAIPDSLRETMFEPYFTTKPAPALGVGLYIARAAAELHDGTLTYTPEQGFALRINRYPAYARKARAQ